MLLESPALMQNSHIPLVQPSSTQLNFPNDSLLSHLFVASSNQIHDSGNFVRRRGGAAGELPLPAADSENAIASPPSATRGPGTPAIGEKKTGTENAPGRPAIASDEKKHLFLPTARGLILGVVCAKKW